MTHKKRILIVDDEADFCSIIQCNLERQGFEVEVAYDGEECLAKVKVRPPDAIILDMIMPEKDGFAVCRAIKTDKKLAAIPILMLTAVASPVTAARYSHRDDTGAQADGYLSKPASVEDISRSLKNLLHD
jgi:two-component system, OmpR family, alkaline phosphatase synthesis response regulator PhoP